MFFCIGDLTCPSILVPHVNLEFSHFLIEIPLTHKYAFLILHDEVLKYIDIRKELPIIAMGNIDKKALGKEAL